MTPGSRSVVSCNPDHRDEIIRLANDVGVPAMPSVTQSPARSPSSATAFRPSTSPAPELERIWSSAFGLLLVADSINDVIRDRGEEVELIPH